MLLNRKKTQGSSDIADLHNPYLNARREWNERYGDYIASARRWQMIGLGSLTLAVTCTGGLIYFAGQNKLIPYVVEVDERGATVQVYESSRQQKADPRVVRAQLAQFIRDLRAVSADRTVGKVAITRLYTQLNNGSQASSFINTYFKEHSPFTTSRDKTVAVDILQLLPLSENTWQAEWSEQSYGRDGKDLGKANYTATMNVSVGNRVTEQTILYNPIGLEVKELHWSIDFLEKSPLPASRSTQDAQTESETTSSASIHS